MLDAAYQTTIKQRTTWDIVKRLWQEGRTLTRTGDAHTGKMPISAFFERWENLPYDAQLLHNVANLDTMDVQKYVYSYALYDL